MLKQAIVLGSLAFGATGAAAGRLDWASTEQRTVVSKLGTAYANATLCNFEVDTDGTARIIENMVAPAGKLTPQMAAGLMFSVVGMAALNDEMLGINRMNKREFAKHCSGIIAAFGPDGTSLPGVLKP